MQELSGILEIANRLSSVSLATLLALILVLSYLDKWCWSRERNAMRADRDEWKSTALANLGLAKRAVDSVAKTVPPS